MKKAAKQKFGISLDTILTKKKKIIQETAEKYQKESKNTKNQKERQKIKESLFAEKTTGVDRELQKILKQKNKLSATTS